MDQATDNIKFLIDRMENALQRDDYALVLKTSVDIFETLAKDIIKSPAVQDQGLGSFYPLFRENSILPKEILDYILDVYKKRNRTPLAGHGSTQMPDISRESAIVLCELTKAFVAIEFKTRDSNVTSLINIENQQAETIQFHLSLSDEGFEKEPDDNLKASFVEAIYAVQKGARVRFEISYLPLELFREIINSPQFSNSSPDARIAKVELRKIADHSRELKLIMEKALNLISTKSIINQISDVSELIEVINGIPQKLSFYEPHSQRNMLIEAFYVAFGKFSKSRQREDFTGIDVFHKTLKLTARFYIDKSQTESLLQKLNLSSEFQLTGDGWYIYDLTDEIRFQKAIPAILIEMAYSELTEDPNIDMDEVLHPAYWRIGLA